MMSLNEQQQGRERERERERARERVREREKEERGRERKREARTHTDIVRDIEIWSEHQTEEMGVGERERTMGRASDIRGRVCILPSGHQEQAQPEQGQANSKQGQLCTCTST